MDLHRIIVEHARPLIRDPVIWEKRLHVAKPAIHMAAKFNLVPTPHFVEFVSYWYRAQKLQQMNLGLRPRGKVGDPLQEAIPIYDTTKRRYAGFSNVLEQLWYGDEAPKIERNRKMGWATPRFEGTLPEWLYICFVHRCTGSGASFEKDHGWRNTAVPEMSIQGSIEEMAAFIGPYRGASCTSIGNQPPAVKKQYDLTGYRNHLQYYLAVDGPVIVKTVWEYLRKRKTPATIKQTLDVALAVNKDRGQKNFVFVFTAWVMDIAEYCPDLVDPYSDCMHGANARQSWDRIFYKSSEKTYDVAARMMATYTKTWPMDIEDVACDAVRWIEGYVPKKGYEHVYEREIYNSSSLYHNLGRQRP